MTLFKIYRDGEIRKRSIFLWLPTIVKDTDDRQYCRWLETVEVTEQRDGDAIYLVIMTITLISAGIPFLISFMMGKHLSLSPFWKVTNIKTISCLVEEKLEKL